MTNWDWTTEIVQLLNDLGLDNKPVLDQDYSLDLNLLRKKDCVFSFIDKAKTMKFNSIKMLQMNWMYKINGDALVDTNAFLKS
mmetsp:Transcript_2472/g.2908  ORF Transcript_2472/g.2908 Transcript_2472/m.2908 type:complete len:83 (+) Transcript_2472:148-396(+)